MLTQEAQVLSPDDSPVPLFHTTALHPRRPVEMSLAG
jgi:hypothetical protein